MKVANIDPTGKVVQGQRHLHVSKSRNEEMKWIAIGNGGPWSIEFDKDSLRSPFSSSQYTVPKAGQVMTAGGPVNGVVEETYRYNVKEIKDTGEVIKTTDDPDVNIES